MKPFDSETPKQQIILNLSEAARSLGVAQVKGDQDAIDYWSAEVTRFEREARQPMPDISALVEALEEARHHVVISPDLVRGGFIQEIDAALATYHNQKDNNQ